MDKLKKKVFCVLVGILTIFLISILIIFNYQNYYNEKDKVADVLTRADEKIGFQSVKPDSNGLTNSENPVFMDATIYTVLFDQTTGKVETIINHSNDDTSEEEIAKVALKIIQGGISTNTIRIGNLFLERYSFSIKEYNKLTIIDNINVQNRLLETLKMSLIIFVLLEIVIVVVSINLTNWIIKPVIESFNKQKTFISDASHELKTPISVIIANGDALENEPTEKKWLDNIRNEADRMSKLVSDLLDLSRLENDEAKNCFNVINLSRLTEKAVLTFESLMYEKKIKFKYDIQEEINYKCNDNQIKQLIAILVDNAIEHTDKGNEIKVQLKKEKSEIILKVINKGKEIPKDCYEKIFERFYRADESRNRENNNYGLGLAIAKNIVSNHNGKIFVNCADGYTTFTAILKE